MILGDGKISLDIKGIGTIKMMIDGHELQVDNVRCIPDLAESIYSLFLHIKCPSHGLNSSIDDGLHITFPSFMTKAILGQDDIYINEVPVSTTSVLQQSPSPNSVTSTSVCHSINQFENEVKQESSKVDNLLHQL